MKKFINDSSCVPIEMYYLVRILPAIYLSYVLPTNITNEEAVKFVAGIAKEKHKKCCLILSRIEKIFIDEDGEIEGKIETKYSDNNYPYVRVK